MKRYLLTKKKKDKGGQIVYTTTYYPEIPIRDSDTFFTTTTGERLDSLAYKFYGDTTLWWIIAKANGIKGIIGLQPGTLLRIPGDIARILEKFRELNLPK